LAVTTVTLGCSSLQGRKVDSGKPLSAVESAKGVSYYLTRPTFRIERKTLAKGKKARPSYDLVVENVPDPGMRFEVGMWNGLFTSDTFKLVLNPEGTASTLNSTTSDQTGRVIASLVEAGAKVARTVAALSVGGASNALKGVSRIPAAERATTDEEIGTLGGLLDALNSGKDLSVEERKRARKLLVKVRKDLVDWNFLDPSPALRASLRGSGDKQVAGVKRVVYELETCLGAEVGKTEDSASAKNVAKKLEVVLGWVQDFDASLKKFADPKPAEVFKALHAELEDALAKDLAASRAYGEAEGRTEPVVKKLKKAVALVLAADEAIHGRALGKRRAELVKFLSTPIVPNGLHFSAQGHKAYAEELRKVTATLMALVPMAKGTNSSELPLATDVTSRINRGVEHYWRASGLSDEERGQLLLLAKARVLCGMSQAVVVTAPVVVSAPVGGAE